MTFIMTKSGVTRHYWHEDSSSSYNIVQSLLKRFQLYIIFWWFACKVILVDKPFINTVSCFFSFDRQNFPSFYRRTVAYPERNAWIYSFINADGNLQKFDAILATKALWYDGAALGGMETFITLVLGYYCKSGVYKLKGQSTK